jgi:hypothetical protein
MIRVLVTCVFLHVSMAGSRCRLTSIWAISFLFFIWFCPHSASNLPMLWSLPSKTLISEHKDWSLNRLSLSSTLNWYLRNPRRVRSRYYTWRWRQHLFNSLILNLWLGFAFSIQTRVSIFFPTAESFIFFVDWWSQVYLVLIFVWKVIQKLIIFMRKNLETINVVVGHHCLIHCFSENPCKIIICFAGEIIDALPTIFNFY